MILRLVVHCRIVVERGPLRVAEREHRHRVLPSQRHGRPVAHRVVVGSPIAAPLVEVGQDGVLVRAQLQVHVLKKGREENQNAVTIM